MNKILSNLFISSLETASSEAALSDASVTHIVSLGCKLDTQHHQIKYLTFPSILDSPESIIVDITVQTNNFIASALCSGGKVLVHCVYGQSRSATVIVAYLITTGFTLEESILHIKDKNPTTCINPGFLAQLKFVSTCHQDSVAWKLLSTQSPCSSSAVAIGSKRKEIEFQSESHVENDLPQVVEAASLSPTIVCKSCRCDLGGAGNILQQSVDVAAFVKAQEDGFWKGYKTSRSKSLEPPVRVPVKGVIAVFPFEWMKAQQFAALHTQSTEQTEDKPSETTEAETSSAGGKKKENKVKSTKKSSDVREIDRCDFTCPGCHAVVGYWRSKGLDLLGEYNLCDLYALLESAMRVKKLRNIPNL